MIARSAQITGLVLAGGLGRRMGGVDKGLQPFDGKPLAAHVVERLAPQVDFLMINANRNAEAYEAFGYPVIRDRIEGYAGPLAGIHAGLSICTTPLLVCAPCDSPRLPPDLVCRLYDALNVSKAQVAIPSTASGLQPTFALIRHEVLPDLSVYISSGQRRVQDWLGRLRLQVVDFDNESAFFNANTVADLTSHQGQLTCK
jgi:molybdopterin-guanine dinucleotide biosynthesis protein A